MTSESFIGTELIAGPHLCNAIPVHAFWYLISLALRMFYQLVNWMCINTALPPCTKDVVEVVKRIEFHYNSIWTCCYVATPPSSWNLIRLVLYTCGRGYFEHSLTTKLQLINGTLPNDTQSQPVLRRCICGYAIVWHDRICWVLFCPEVSDRLMEFSEHIDPLIGCRICEQFVYSST
jgi:hypothetical protein